MILQPGTAESETEADEKDRRRTDFDPARIMLHPGSGSRRKNWPLDSFLTLKELLSVHGFKAEFLLGPAEAHWPANGLTPVTRPENLVSLTETLKSCGAFIGNDSGATHLAAFIGVPTVAIFGPSDPVRWGPRGRSACVMRSDEKCPPCFESSGQACPSLDCLERISPDTVVNTLIQRLRS
ncbi:MAG: glycosyltransferase family 9 protein [Desulfobacteraceae bacterium]|nr:glycosyltransferase family 9 protein [Desulfobacteraceae bacterium]